MVDLSNAALNSSFEYNPVSQEWTLDKPLNVSLVSKLTADESSLEFSQGAGLNFDASANRTLRIKALGITDAMIAAGTITNAKLVNQSVNYNGVSVALGASGSINLNNSISEGAGIAAFTFNGSGNATVAIDNLGVSNAMLAGGITEDKLFGAIPNGKLANSTISGVALGSNLFDLSVDNSSIEFSAGGPYNGGAAAGIRVKAGGITNAMLLNDGIVVNGVSASLGGSIVVTANLANALSAGSNLTIGAPFDGSAAQTIALSNTLTGLASVSSIAFDGALTGNASTATTLQTPRNINGVAFDGSADISVYAVTYEDLQISDDLHAGIGLTSFNGSLTKTIGIQPGKVTNTMLATPSITINGTAVALGGTRDLSLQDVCTVGNTTTTNINALAFFQTSKREKKKDIVPFEKSALEIIKKTSIVEFKYKDDETNKVHIGFIADDTPVELSTVNQDVMDTNSAIGVLLKAVQELEAKVRELEAK